MTQEEEKLLKELDFSSDEENAHDDNRDHSQTDHEDSHDQFPERLHNSQVSLDNLDDELLELLGTQKESRAAGLSSPATSHANEEDDEEDDEEVDARERRSGAEEEKEARNMAVESEIEVSRFPLSLRSFSVSLTSSSLCIFCTDHLYVVFLTAPIYLQAVRRIERGPTEAELRRRMLIEL